jgi:hypothetical protein
LREKSTASSLWKPPASVSVSEKVSPGGSLARRTKERRDHSGEDDADLVFLGDADRLAAAGDGVEDDEQAAADDGASSRQPMTVESTIAGA